jgi:CubicO group peptidase (beta-lactamase class C family)
MFLKQVSYGAAACGVASSLPVCLTAQAAAHHDLPRSSPEAQGVASAEILAFLDAVGKSNHEFHSFMMLRHGHVIAEGWWAPYRAKANHMLYSLSKSFTSTAVGFAVTEGRLTVDDKVVHFFPDDLPATVSDHLAALRVRDLLTMSVGHAKDSTPLIRKEDNWVRAFLALPIENPPGSAFLYNSGATYMLSAIVQKLTGQRVIDYLGPRLFEPVGIRDMTWETCPRGINTGGWGLSLQTEYLAKFGQFYLQKGAWNGKQILPQAWIEEATTFKIQQPAAAGQDLEKLKQTSEWHQGYCYQFWRCRHDVYRGDGAMGQYTIVMPHQDAVIVMTTETDNMQGEMNLVWQFLLPAIKEQLLPADTHSEAQLKQKLASLLLPLPQGRSASPLIGSISGKAFKIEPNDAGVQSVALRFEKQACTFTLTDSKGSHSIKCGLEKWVDGKTDMPGTPPKLTTGSLGPESKIAAGAAWKDDQTLEMMWHFYETPHHDVVTCHFDGDKVKVEFMNSITQKSTGHPETRPALQGQLTA